MPFHKLVGEVCLVGKELCFTGTDETGYVLGGASLKSILLSVGHDDTSTERPEKVRIEIILPDGSFSLSSDQEKGYLTPLDRFRFEDEKNP